MRALALIISCLIAFATPVRADLIAGMGLESVDLGGVRSAHWIEGMTILWINNRITDRPDFEFYLRRID